MHSRDLPEQALGFTDEGYDLLILVVNVDSPRSARSFWTSRIDSACADHCFHSMCCG